MYTDKDVNEMLSQVEQELEQTLGDIMKSENAELEAQEVETEEVEAEEVIAKSEEDVSEEDEAEEYTIEELYDSMSKSEKEAHYSAVKKSIYGELKEVEVEKIAKSEDNSNEAEMFKSENEELKAKHNKLEKSYNELNELVGKLLKSTKSAPKRKSITEEYDVIAKSEKEEKEGIDLSSLSKSEITNKLKGLDYSELNKAERTAINEYCVNNGSVEKIKHLIKE